VLFNLLKSGIDVALLIFVMSLSVHLTRSRPRLLIAIGIGFFITLLLPSSWNFVTRMLAGWNIAVWSYLVLASWLMMHASSAKVKTIAEQEDNSAIAVLAIMSIAATLSLAAIVFELASAKEASSNLRPLHYAFTIMTVMGAWLLVAIVYTFHYAHSFYRSPSHQRALRFPEEEPHPDYWDFLYFSFTIAVAAQTSNISIMSRAVRKAVLAQSVLSFLFNAAIVGLSINIAAGLVGS